MNIAFIPQKSKLILFFRFRSAPFHLTSASILGSCSSSGLYRSVENIGWLSADILQEMRPKMLLSAARK
jgi:hypothetical protein